MSIQADLEQLAELVESADFRAKQEAFYVRHCHEFVAEVDEGSSNKLSYTTIHNTYVEEVENDICVAMGQEALSNIMTNIESFLADRSREPDERIAVTLDVLTSMSDFEHFKATMIAKRDEQAQSDRGGMGMGGGTVIDMDDELNKCADLLQASAESGWRVLGETEDVSVWVKSGGPGKRFIRGSITIDLPPDVCC